MKRKLRKLLFVLAILFTVSASASAQIYVKIRPRPPVIVRTVQPSRAHIWINEEWEPNNGSYRYAGGHWEAPPHRNYRWRQGYWKRHDHNSYVWVRGSWRRR